MSDAPPNRVHRDLRVLAASSAGNISLTNPARGIQSMEGSPSESTVSDFYVIAGIGNGVPIAAENGLHITGNFDRPSAMVGPPNPPPVGRYLRPCDLPFSFAGRTRKATIRRRALFRPIKMVEKIL